PPSLGIDDALAVVAHSVLADGMIEDLLKLQQTNSLVKQAGQLKSLSGRKYQVLEYIAVAPPAGELAKAAGASVKSRWFPSFHTLRYRGLRTFLRFTGTGPGRDELLSYVLFDANYADAQFKQAKIDVPPELAAGWQT